MTLSLQVQIRSPSLKSLHLFVKDPYVQGLVKLFLETRETTWFEGLPSPCSAILL